MCIINIYKDCSIQQRHKNYVWFWTQSSICKISCLGWSTPVWNHSKSKLIPRNIWINVDQDIFLRKDVLLSFCPLDLLFLTSCKTGMQIMHGASSKATQFSNMVSMKFSPQVKLKALKCYKNSHNQFILNREMWRYKCQRRLFTSVISITENSEKSL